MIRKFKGKSPHVGKEVYIDPSSTLIGDVVLGDHVSIWPGVIARGDMHQIRIGAGTNIQDGSILHVTHPSDYNPEGYALTLGRDITVGHQVVLHGCTIHDSCLIGMGSLLMDGVTVESQVIIGAGSLVPPGKVLTSGWLWVGRPVVAKRLLTSEELAFIEYSAQNYKKLKNEYLKEPS